MKKLKLSLDTLEVSSFVPEKASGSVHGMEAITQAYGCGHTAEAGCYPSKYCSGPGCVITYQDTCMTDNVYAC